MTITLSMTTNLNDPGDDITGTSVLTPITEVKTHLENTLNGSQGFEVFKQVTSTATIASGVLSLTGKTDHIVVSAESGTSDQLDSISGGTAGRRVRLFAASGHTITIAHSSSIVFQNATNMSMTSSAPVELVCDGTNWYHASPLPTAPTADKKLLVARTTLGTSSSLTISSIDQTYDDLEIYLELRSSTAAQTDIVRMQLGGASLDTTAGNYFSYDVINFGATPTVTVTANDAANAQIRWNALGASATASHAAYARIYIRNYARSAEMKHIDILNGGVWGASGAQWQGQTNGLWKNTSNTVQQIKLDWNSGANFASPSSYTIWGINA